MEPKEDPRTLSLRIQANDCAANHYWSLGYPERSREYQEKAEFLRMRLARMEAKERERAS